MNEPTTENHGAVKGRAQTFTVEQNQWHVASLSVDTSGRNDGHFLLDPTTGMATFGDGEKGACLKGCQDNFAFHTTQRRQGMILAEFPSWPIVHNRAVIKVR